jgi:hypothetical protein
MLEALVLLSARWYAVLVGAVLLALSFRLRSVAGVVRSRHGRQPIWH